VVVLAEPKKKLLLKRRRKRKKRWTWAEAWTCSAEKRLAAATIKQILVSCIY
jgi:isopentenyldiphosphate isomerase